MTVDKDPVAGDVAIKCLAELEDREKRKSEGLAVGAAQIVDRAFDQQIAVGAPVMDHLVLNFVEQAEDHLGPRGDRGLALGGRLVGEAELSVGGKVPCETLGVHLVNGAEELRQPALARRGLVSVGGVAGHGGLVRDWITKATTYNTLMSNKDSKLSRRELFGRLVGRSRSDAMAEKSPDSHPSTLRADELLRAGEYQKASELYARLILREPDFSEGYRKLGWCYLRLGETQEARRVLEQLLEQQPDDATALLYVGLSHAHEGAAEKAVTVWQHVHDYNRIVVQREINLVQFLSQSGQVPSAEELVEKIEQAIAEQNVMPGSQGVYY